MSDHIIRTNHIQLNYVDYEAEGKPTLIMMHGITANAHAFDGLVKHGLNDHFHLVSVDLRGRGQSDKPAFGYAMADHARDIMGLLDHLGIEKATLCGHSFGGLLSAYLAANFPERVAGLILLDAAAELNPLASKMLTPVFSRLGNTYPSFEAFLDLMRNAPQNTFWEDVMESYYAADVHTNRDGTVSTNSNLANIMAVAMGVVSVSWSYIFDKVQQPAILINATDPYTLGEILLPGYKALETVAMMGNATYTTVTGNHQTMLYGENADKVVAAILGFWKKNHKVLKQAHSLA
jgi:pimeloyl-ACP methyl ester carboxylesterase